LPLAEIMLPSPIDLVYFLEVVAVLNVSKAAERLGLTQPTLSQAIKRLEDNVGESLFVRGKKGVTLTPGGRILASHGRELLDVWRRVRADALDATTQVQGRVTIGCHPSVAMFTLSRFIPEAMREHPSLEIKLIHDMSRKITEAVAANEIDIGIVVNPFRQPNLVINKLADDIVTLWRSKDLPMGKATFASLPLIMDPSLSQGQRLIRRLHKSPISIGRVVESSSLEVVADLISSGAGVGILPSRVAERSGVNLIAVAGAPVLKDEISVVIRQESRRLASVRYLVDALKAAF
jgi:DNA-binding transcriptional LysR family regulator